MICFRGDHHFFSNEGRITNVKVEVGKKLLSVNRFGHCTTSLVTGYINLLVIQKLINRAYKFVEICIFGYFLNFLKTILYVGHFYKFWIYICI